MNADLFDFKLLPVWVLVIIALAWTLKQYGIPVISYMQSANTMRIKDLEAEVTHLKEQVKDLEEMKVQYQSLLSKLNVLDKLLDSRQESSDILKAILNGNNNLG